MRRVLADVGAPVPAPFALRVAAGQRPDRERLARLQRHGRRNEDELEVRAEAADRALLESLGDDLKFVTITSKAVVEAAEALSVGATPSSATKCDRCWHWRSDVGIDKAHPTICGRCVSNLFGAGEARKVA